MHIGRGAARGVVRSFAIGASASKVQRPVVEAVGGLANVALRTVIAVVIRHDDVIAGSKAQHRLTDKLDDTDAFMPENDWELAQTLGCLLYTSPSPRDRG